MNNVVKSLASLFIIILMVENCFAQETTNSGLQKVIIIRHAEKPDNGDNLSCKGFNRSLQLPAVLYSKFKLPNQIFVPSVGNGKSTNQSRMFETIIPFAVKYNLEINSKFDVTDTKDLASAITKTNGYVLVVWEHNNIDNIVKALGADTKGIKWSGNDFDSIWIINFKNGKAILSFDKENLNPADACNY
jgi:hypothetical protein